MTVSCVPAFLIHFYLCHPSDLWFNDSWVQALIQQTDFEKK